MTRDKAIMLDEWVGDPRGWMMPDNPDYISNRMTAQINRRGCLMQQLRQFYLSGENFGDKMRENEKTEQIEVG